MDKPTYGEAIVRCDFNPSNDSDVDRVKQCAARLVNAIRELPMPDNLKRANRFGHLRELAIICAEESAMWGVKAATMQYEKIPEIK